MHFNGDLFHSTATPAATNKRKYVYVNSSELSKNIGIMCFTLNGFSLMFSAFEYMLLCVFIDSSTINCFPSSNDLD